MAGRWVFVCAFAFVFFANGAGFIESFVNYESWHLIGESEFRTYHQFITRPVVAFLVVPALLGTLLTVALLRFRPTSIPLWSVWCAIALQSIMWISTATIQVPIQLELSEHGLSLPAIERLIETNFWLRRVPFGMCAGLFLWMAGQALDRQQF